MSLLIFLSKLFACKCSMLPSAQCICDVTPHYFSNNTLAASGTPERKHSDECQQVSFKAGNMFIRGCNKNIVHKRSFDGKF